MASEWKRNTDAIVDPSKSQLRWFGTYAVTMKRMSFDQVWFIVASPASLDRNTEWRLLEYAVGEGARCEV
eukprot:CAMPEP_0183381666 /NCGR_PEP_ID=MMETSP0164_2-20130417/126554_1 /TAXON_ID=221442 /ORGANISM="Coccolithus pelagicus ssp braarudi, Strain PLY182g" /LENGTH=69 /DNA_ID=CAMNT_0025559277 /DNA_START=838 /DNA_END=1047 /DNA_ORIENTATION=-